MSMDIDLAILTGIDHRAIRKALEEIGYTKHGRVYVHPKSAWTIDIVADTPYIVDRPITTYAEVQTRFGSVRTYELEDALADRVAAFLFWNDSQSLHVAERLMARRAHSIRWSRLKQTFEALEATDALSEKRLNFATKRLRAAYRANRTTG